MDALLFCVCMCHNLKQEDWKKFVQLIFLDFNIKKKQSMKIGSKDLKHSPREIVL